LATRFEPLSIADAGLFGVRLSGSFGRGDRQRMLDLATRCLERDKTRVVLECTGLDSLGGGGAAVLADLQEKLIERGGEAVFVAAGDVVRRFLTRKFDQLPLRFFDDVETAIRALGSNAAATAAPEPPAAKDENLDHILDDVEGGDSEAEDHTRRVADLVTAAYVSLDDTLQAAGPEGNPAVLGEALAVLLDSQDLAAETVFFTERGESYVSADGNHQLPREGNITTSLLRIRRPLTLLDFEYGSLWDVETEILESLQPDLILPLLRGDQLEGIAFLWRPGEEREYNLAEIFALELLQRALAEAAVPPAPESMPATAVTDGAPKPPTASASARSLSPAAASQTLTNAKLDLARGLQEAQDVPHFWQVFISRLRLAAEITSLIYLDESGSDEPQFLAGEARRGTGDADLASERIVTFFRTLERPVEVVNMPASFQTTRDAFLNQGVQWLVGLQADDGQWLGMVALGIKWRCDTGDPGDEIRDLMEITGEALRRLREGQRRADMGLGLLEAQLVASGNEPDRVTKETAQAVRLLSRELGLPPDQERDLVLGALLRNHGQDASAPSDLEADRLTGADWEQFRAHPDQGVARLACYNPPAAVRDAVRHHHERFDGRGFPLGLKGRDIPLVARLVAVAQCYALHLVNGDASAALGWVQQEAGAGLDPDLVELFVKACQREPELVPA
jgi:HD-GYP domain-containing protein (c-di-GMP phosphodiesterase class II)/anti-anti-sigma regulatory factor